MSEVIRPKADPQKDILCYRLLTEQLSRLGLELNMSEAARLRRIIRECRLAQDQIQDFASAGFDISSEAISRFFNEAYGVDLDDYLYSGVLTFQECERRFHDLTLLIRRKLRLNLEML